MFMTSLVLMKEFMTKYLKDLVQIRRNTLKNLTLPQDNCTAIERSVCSVADIERAQHRCVVLSEHRGPFVDAYPFVDR